MTRGRWFLLALLAYCAIAVSLTGPALLGQGSLIPEGFLDKDLLYRHSTERAKLRPFEDPWPVTGELGRERVVAAGLGQGRIDTWNPWIGSGAPLWAESGNPFFPTKFIYYLYPNHLTLMAALAARLVVVALGMFLLARALGLSPLIALFTGALLEYSGIYAANLPYMSSSAAYLLPWVLLGAHKLCTERGLGAVAMSGLALGIALHGGHPSYILLVCLGFGAWILGEWAHKRPPLNEVKHMARLVIAVGVIAFLIAAVGLFPFLELVVHAHSYKYDNVSELIWTDRLRWTREVFAIALFVPSLITASRDTMPNYLWPWAEGASIGLVALLLAIAGAQKFREHWGLALVGILGLGLTLVPIGLQWLHQLPGVRIILPWYCYPLLIVPLCLAAGFGLQILAAAPRKNLLLVPFVAGVVGVVLGVAFVWFGMVPIGWTITNALKDIVGLDLLTVPIRIDLSILSDWHTYVSPVAGIVAVVAYALLCRANLARAAAILAVLALIEAAAIRIPTVNFERSVVLRSGPSEATTRLQALLSGGLWRFIGGPPFQVGIPNSGLLFELRDLRSNSSLPIRRQTKFIELAGTTSEIPNKERPTWQSPYPTWQSPPVIRLPMLSLAAVKFVLYSKPLRDSVVIPPGLQELDTFGEVVFFENPFALPRFRIVHDVIPVEGEQQAFETLQRLLDDSPSGAANEWARRAVIEGIGRDEAVRARAEPDLPGNLEAVRRLAEPDPQTIVLEANLAAPGFVIVADTFYPGWTATVDDVPTTIHPANLLFRAVAVPAGRHTIVMKYASSWVRIGAVLTLIGLLVVAALFVRDRSLNRRLEHRRLTPEDAQ